MEHQIAKHLNWYYYGMMVLAIIAATLPSYLISKELLIPIDSMSTLGKTIQYVVIFDALITIPFGLYGFKRACTRLTRSAALRSITQDPRRRGARRPAGGGAPTCGRTTARHLPKKKNI